jgi:PAS domain S-box-containing protein
MEKTRIASLQWAAGVFCSAMGVLILVAPHQFEGIEATLLRANLIILGMALTVTGVGLFGIPVNQPKRWFVIATHGLAGFLLVVIAFLLIRQNAHLEALKYAVLGSGVAVAGLTPGAWRPRRGFKRGDLLAVILGAGSLLTGLALLVAPTFALGSLYRLDAANGRVWGILFALSGVFLIAVQEYSVNKWIYRAAHLAIAAVFLAFLPLATLPHREWAALFFFGGFGIVLAFLPWLGPRLERMEANSLRGRLAFTLAVAASAPLVIAVTLTGAVQEQRTIQQTLERYELQAQATALSISQNVRLLKPALHYIKEEIAQAAPEDRPDLLERFARTFAQPVALVVYDDFGRMTAAGGDLASVGLLGSNLNQAGLFEEAWQTGDMAIDVIRPQPDRRTIIRLAAPIFGEAGQFEGVLTLHMTTHYFLGLLVDSPSEWPQRFYIVDGGGRVIAHSWFGSPDLFAHAGDVPPVAAFLAGDAPSGHIEYRQGSQRQLAAYAKAPGTDWAIIIDQPAQRALGPLLFSREQSFSILFLVQVLMAAGGIYVAGVLSSRLVRITHAIDQLAEEKLDSLLPSSRVPEIDRLAAAANRMAERLAARTAERQRAEDALYKVNLELEQRIEQRTQQLQDAYSSLAGELAERRRAEAAFRALVENIPDGIIRYDRDVNPLYLSPAVEKIAEIAQADDKTGSTSDEKDGALLAAERVVIRRVYETGQPASLELSRRTGDGMHYFEVRYIPEQVAGGEVESVLAVWRDITGRKRIEEALRVSEERFRVASTQSGTTVFSLDQDLKYTWVHNPHHALNRQEFVNQTNLDLLPADKAKEITEIMQGVLQSGKGDRREFEFSDGNARYTIDLILEPVFDSAGRVSGLLGSAYDVTERRRLLEEIDHQRGLLQTIFESTPAGIAVVAGENLEFRFTNPAYRHLTPHPELDPQGRAFEEVWPPGENYRGSWLLGRVMATNKPFHIDRYALNFPEGQTRYFSIDMRKLLWGEEESILVVMWDTTPMEEAYRQSELSADEARQRASEAEEGRRVLNAVLDHVPEGVAIAEAGQGSFGMISKFGANMLGISPDAPDSISLDEQNQNWKLSRPDNLEPVPSSELPLNRALEHGEVVMNEEWVLRYDDQNFRFISCNAAPIRNAQDQIIGGLLTWTDITEKKQVEEALANYALQLERSNQELQEFAFVASHDLKEPLRKIDAFAERLKYNIGRELSDKNLDYLNRMQDATIRMRTMIDELLSLSRITTRGRPFVEVSLESVAQEALHDLEETINRAEGKVEINSLPVIEADPAQMQHLLLNLIGNALKFHKPDTPPLIKVYATPAKVLDSEAWIQLCVEDNGIGFSMEHVDRIFQPFHRLHGRGVYDGSGMGLSICRKIVERHGGSITAASEPGKGSTFMVNLPVRRGP